MMKGTEWLKVSNRRLRECRKLIMGKHVHKGNNWENTYISEGWNCRKCKVW